MSGGSERDACEMAACTSCAAASIFRSSVNCNVMVVRPRELEDDMPDRLVWQHEHRSCRRLVPTDVIDCPRAGLDLNQGEVAVEVIARFVTGHDA